MIVTLFVVAITMVVSVLAAYSLSRMRFFGSGVLATGIFLTYLVPETLLFIPLFKVVGALGLLDTIWALVLVYPTLSVPFCTWIMIGYFASIPKELDEAALIDGANHLQMLLKIFAPVAIEIIAATISPSPCLGSLRLPHRLSVFGGKSGADRRHGDHADCGDVYHWGGLMAGALLAAAAGDRRL